jgi:hypothetical protein
MYCPSKTIKLRCSCVDPLYVISMCEATAIWIQSTPSCVNLLCCMSVRTNWVQIVLTTVFGRSVLCYMQYWPKCVETAWVHSDSTAIDMHLWRYKHSPWKVMYMYWFQPLCGYISQNRVQMVLVHWLLPAIVMLHVLSIQNNQIEMQLCGATVCDIYVWSYSHLNSVDSILCGATVLHVSSN